ncbi:MAG: thiamine pyrophosphate-dependent enzyme [Pseudomonadota bacterium]
MTQTFTPGRPIWCAGCGDFGVLQALEQGLDALEIPRHEAMVIAGIGCSGSLQNNLRCYGYHAVHGRTLPTATGAKLANPDLTVVAVGGDGDGYAIGGGHFLHCLKRNPGVVYIVMNNGTYGLTKGQASPTSLTGYKGNIEEDLDPILLGLSIPGSSFLARAYSGEPAQLSRLTQAALTHAREGKGFAYLEVLSPCVTYNDTYREWRAKIIDMDADESYNATNRAESFMRLQALRDEGRLPLGLLYQGERASMESGALAPDFAPPAKVTIDPQELAQEYADAMATFAQ